MPRSLAPLGAALLLVPLAACHDDPAGLRRGGPAYVAVQPVISPGVDLAAFGLSADTVRLLVIRPPADTVRALTVFFDPDSAEVRLATDVLLRAAVETLTVHLELRGGGFALFSGTQRVAVRAGGPAATPAQIALTYTGPGSNIAVVTIVPRDTVLSFGDSLRFRVTARDSSAAPVALGYLRWGSSDTTVMRLNAAGLARAPRARAGVYVRARTPTGIADSTPLTIIPTPTALSVVSGAGQSAIVGVALPLPLRVRVTAADGLGVKGIAIKFRALGGGSVADSLVVADTGGYAETVGTLGTIAGVDQFEASAPGLPATSLGATALAGAVSAATSIVTASLTNLLSGAVATLTLRAKDTFGNSVTTGGRTVVFTATGGTSTGVIGSTTDHGDGSYTATLTGVRAGTALTIGATIDGAPVTSSPLPAITVLAGPVAQVVVSPASATLDALGVTQPFSAVAKDANGNVVPGAAFTWTSDNPLVAGVDASGVVTAVANGSATITATTGGVSGTSTLSVTQIVRSVVVSPAAAAVSAVGTPQPFAAVALDRNGRSVAGQTFAWSSSDPTIATVDASGLATTLASGSVTITATTAGVTGTATLSVQQVLTSVVVTPPAATLAALGFTQQFSAVAQDANGKPILGPTFTWSAAPAGVASIDPVTGLATAVGNGVATITATTGGVSGTATLSVAQVVTSVVVSPAAQTLDALGLTQQFTAVALDAKGNAVSGQSFAWTSSAPGIATVDAATGLATAIGNGVATIIATAAGVQGTASLTVAQVVKAVAVSPPTATLAGLGLTQQFTAVATDATGHPVGGQTFTWSSSLPLIVGIDQNGLATALGIGSATITATTTGGVKGTATVSVL